MPPFVLNLLFDFDGVLLDTEPLFDEVYQDFCLCHTGRRMDEERLKELKIKLFGRSLAETIDVLCHEMGIKPVSIEEFRAFQDPLLLDRLPHAPLLPGAEELIVRLSRAHVPIAIATSAPRHYFLIKISKRLGLFRRFNVIVTADDVTACKPAPDLFLTAAKRLAAKPENCLVFEDAPSGIEAAKRAGMTAIAIPPKDADLSLYADADRILSSLNTFDPVEWGLPDLPPLAPETLKALST